MDPTMESYLLVRDSDGAILDELDSESVVRTLEHFQSDAPWLRGLSLVRVADRPGAIIGATSFTTVRSAEFAPPPRRRRT